MSIDVLSEPDRTSDSTVTDIGCPMLRSRDGSVIPLLVERWTSAPTAAEMVVLDRAVGPVIDVGCGPGRHVCELAARGVVALGIDISPDAVAVAHTLGSAVLQRSVFERVPNEGRWRTALLMDGNIGIGGDAVALLTRLRDVTEPHGAVLVEVDAPGEATQVEWMRVERDGQAGPWFAWARVSIDGIDEIARWARLTRAWTYEEEGRWFVQLRS